MHTFSYQWWVIKIEIGLKNPQLSWQFLKFRTMRLTKNKIGYNK